MLYQALSKLVIRAAGDQAKTACGNLQLCAGLEADIEGATHAAGQRKLERERAIRSEEEDGSSYEEEVTETVVVGLNNLTIETAGTEEEATEGLEAALQMDIDEEGEVDCEGEEEDDGTQGELGAL